MLEGLGQTLTVTERHDHARITGTPTGTLKCYCKSIGMLHCDLRVANALSMVH
jgi:hypothetical protein